SSPTNPNFSPRTLAVVSSSTITAILASSHPLQQIINAQAVVAKPPSRTFIFSNKTTTEPPHHSFTTPQSRHTTPSHNHPRRQQRHQPPFVSCNKRPISTIAATSP
ncbi:hypothetical protein V8G54_004276, partial [Vigna mungo]